MSVKSIKCYCETNPDFRGVWNAADVEDELEEDGLPDGVWIEYILGRVFGDVKDWTPETEAAVSNDAVNEITLTLGGHKVTIKKFYHTEF